MYFPDLSNENYFVKGSMIKSVGWLSKEQDYTRGATPVEVVKKLQDLINNGLFQPIVFRGLHHCDLCQFDGEPGYKNLFIPGNECIYVSPEMILHYITTHWYKPPDEFIGALLNCPPHQTMEYKKLFLANGGRELLKLLKIES